ncbi:MAG: transglutaminase-like domain-containing protein [Eubacterium sp.]|nr:transglutaminase-like domain-containing protein [Eubacterium sp.]
MINSNKTEESRASEQIVFLLPGGIITFFLGFFMLKSLGVKDMSLLFGCCYLFFFCGIILIMAYYRKTGWVTAASLASAALLIIIYRDSMLTVNIAVSLASLLIFFILNKLLKRTGFAVFMLGNDIYWCIKHTDNRLLVGFLVVGTLYALGRFVRKNADAYIIPVMLLMFAVLLPINKGPMKWTFVKRFIDNIAKVSEFDKEEYDKRNKKTDNIFTGYSGDGTLVGALSTKYRGEITFRRDSGSDPIYLKGSRFVTVYSGGLMRKEDQEVTCYDWAFYLVNGLINAGISPEEASSFIAIETAEIEYTLMRTEDIICPENIISINVILDADSEGKKTKGFNYKVKYLTIDRTDPVYEKLIRTGGKGGNRIHTREELMDYFNKLYELETAADEKGDGVELFALARYRMLYDRTEYWDGYIKAVNASKPIPDKQGYDNSYLYVSEYDIDRYLDTSMATERMEELVRSITDGLDDPYDKALAIEKYLHTHYKYSKKVDLRGYDNYVDAFLFEVQKGYCVHFASAMVVMLRIAGVPSRYVSGYHYNYRTTMVMSSDAHAWPEAYISGVGWVPFEPTGVSVEMEQSSYEPDGQISDSGVTSETAEESENKKETSEFKKVLRLILLYIGIILAAAVFFILIVIAVRRIIFYNLPPERKLQEIVKVKCREIEKGIKSKEEKEKLRANSTSLYEYTEYAADSESKNNLKKLLDRYYLVRFRGDSISDDEIKKLIG